METARKEAMRRKKEGKRNVTITVIDTSKPRRRVEYRNARGLASRLGCEIPEQAWHNSKYEWLFLHHIPQWAVMCCIQV